MCLQLTEAVDYTHPYRRLGTQRISSLKQENMSGDVKYCFLMKHVCLSRLSCKYWWNNLGNNISQKTNVLRKFECIIKDLFFSFFRWDEDTIELAQTWVPKDISKTT